MEKDLWRRGAAGVLASLLLLTTGCGAKKENTAFQPKLDTKASVELNVLGFFGNFEALDQVTNDFNGYYPNVTFNYQQVGGAKTEAYLDANDGVDIFMTSPQSLAIPGGTLPDRCVDLKEAGVDTGAIDGDMLKLYELDGRQLSIPMGQHLTGVVANVTLLQKEGLAVPTTTEEFLSVLAALKEKGYTPIQGPTSKVYAELIRGYAFAALSSDDAVLTAAKAGAQTAVDALMPAFDFLDTVLQQGYTDPSLNDTYPDDNYDGAILKFFEGDVPFWVCDTEKVSGMKKRESKSEAFQASPFTYSFCFSPIGPADAKLYQEPWYAFAANKDGDNKDYAIEFLRFLATTEEINKIADIKGVPSVAKESTAPAVYQTVLSHDLDSRRCTNTGAVTADMETGWYSTVTGYVSGAYNSKDAAIRDFFTSIH